MRAHEAARQLGVSIKALRYYEASGLLQPARLPNGYRDYSDRDLDLARHITILTALGLTVEHTRPFIDCLRRGHTDGEACVESLVAYRREIERLDALIARLTASRDQLQKRLDIAARRGFPDPGQEQGTAPTKADWNLLPDGLSVPPDDSSAHHLVGCRLPSLILPTSDGGTLDLTGVGPGRWVLFLYPMTGVPGQDMPRGWEEIPGARGCTAEACGFRDHIGALRATGARAVLGLSGQPSPYQAELARRLHLPYPLLSDVDLQLAPALTLPTFEVEGVTYYQRLTLIVSDTTIEHVFFPISPPNEHAAQVFEWFREHPPSKDRSGEHFLVRPQPAAHPPHLDTGERH